MIMEQNKFHLNDLIQNQRFKGFVMKLKTQNKKNTYSINQTQLSKQLGLSTNVLRYLRDTNILKAKKVHQSVMYETNSIKKFVQTFKRKDYLTVSECKSKLDRWGFYSTREKGVYMNSLGFYISVISLIRGNEMANECKLSVIQFATTKFISKKSFVKTLKWLHNENKRLHSILPKDFEMKRTTKGSNGIKNLCIKKPKFKKK